MWDQMWGWRVTPQIYLMNSKKGGAAEGTRTPDPRITNALLYQLSYSGIAALLYSFFDER